MDAGKQLFCGIASLYGSSLQELYEKYLVVGCDFRLPFKKIVSTLKSKEKTFKSLFVGKGPDSSPKYFSFWEYRDVYLSSDLARFEETCLPRQATLIVLLKTPSKYFTIYDGRTRKVLTGEAIEPKSRAVFAVYNIKSKIVAVLPDGGGESQCELHNRLWEFSSGGTLWKDQEFSVGESLCEALREQVSGLPTDLTDLPSLVENYDRVAESLGGRGLLLVSHRSTDRKRNALLMERASNNRFTYLGFWEGESQEALDNVLVVAIGYAFKREEEAESGDLYWSTRLEGGWKTRVLKEYAEHGKRPTSLSGEQAVGVLGTKFSQQISDNRKRKLSDAEGLRRKFRRIERPPKRATLIDDCWDFDEPDTPPEEGSSCQCEMCKKGRLSYGSSVSATGPQVRFPLEFDGEEHLKVFGLDSEQNKQILQEVERLSIAAFDIEATTEYLSEGSAEELKYQTISPLKRPTTKLAVQRSQLIGYGDTFSPESQQFHYKEFELSEEGDGVLLAKDFYLHLRERQQLLEEKKTKLLGPILTPLEKLFRAYVLYAISYDEDDPPSWETHGPLLDTCAKEPPFSLSLPPSFSPYENKADGEKLREAVTAAKNSPIGRCLKFLYFQQKQLRVFGFNNSRYDNVLLLPDLACAFKELNNGSKGMDIRTSGSTIKRIAFPREGIYIQEVRDLLGASSSLSKFAELANLEEKKLAFPFSQFTGKEFLKNTSFSKRREDWFDVLRQESPPQEKIDEVIAEYEKGGFRNLGEFLSHYLKLDVVLLGKATIKFLESMKKNIGSSPISTGKLTISSFSSNAVQNYLYRNKKAGCFSPDFKELYHIIRSSCLGGLCVVARHNCGETSGYINDHILEKDVPRRKGKHVVYAGKDYFLGEAHFPKALIQAVIIVAT